jgi:hypothetical protein
VVIFVQIRGRRRGCLGEKKELPAKNLILE